MKSKRLALQLPAEFLDLCKSHGTTPDVVLRGFIADLCAIQSYVSNPRADGYCSNGSDERWMARDYYNRVGYPYGRNESPK